MKILFIGDVFSKSGRRILTQKLPNLIQQHGIDLVIANAENITHGKGIQTKDIALLKSLGVQIFTGGNHSFSHKDIYDIFVQEPTVIRPANYPATVAGRGFCLYQEVLVINLIGRTFMLEGLDSPFQVVDKILANMVNENLKAIIIDFHAETTSEKSALFHYLNGRVSAVLGTHTHVQTADEHVSNLGTAFISDVGMTGPLDSIIGMDKNIVLSKFLTAINHHLEPADSQAVLCAVVIDILDGKAKNIQRLRIIEDEKE